MSKIETGYRLPATSYRLIMAALLLRACAGCRQDMHDQPNYTAYKASDFFPDWRSAQTFFEANGGPASDPHGLDADHDGIACETLP